MSSWQTTSFSLHRGWSTRSSLMSCVLSNSFIGAGSKRDLTFYHVLTPDEMDAWNQLDMYRHSYKTLRQLPFFSNSLQCSSPTRYCVLLITGDEETFSFGNQAFLSFASTNTREVVRFAYVYQRLQQPLCDILMQNKDSAQPPPQVQSHTCPTLQLPVSVNEYEA